MYQRGSFDLTELTIEEDGDDYIFTARFATKVLDPWQSKDWDGNGFSLQYVQVYLDTKKGTGNTRTLPGINMIFPETGNRAEAFAEPTGQESTPSRINARPHQ